MVVSPFFFDDVHQIVFLDERVATFGLEIQYRDGYVMLPHEAAEVFRVILHTLSYALALPRGLLAH